MATNDPDSDLISQAPVTSSSPTADIPATRAVAFPDNDEQHDEMIESFRPKGVAMGRTMTQEDRAVAFGDDDEEKRPGHSRPKGVAMSRTMTQEDRDLAAAGYEHLEEKKTKAEKDKSEFEHVDIYEHALSFDELAKLHDTSFIAKDPAQSTGLTSTEAGARSARDGKNVLTPPKKKSALRKVCPFDILANFLLTVLIVFRLPQHNVQHPFDCRWYPRVCPLGYPIQSNRYSTIRCVNHLNTCLLLGKFPEYIPGRYLDCCGVPERLHRVLSAAEIRGYPRQFPRHDPPIVSRGS